MTGGRRGVVLVGLRRAGKTTVGRLLATDLDLPFVDLDARIAARVGLEAGAIIRRDGEPAFRRHERAALEEVVVEPPAVLAPGAGAPMTEGSGALLRAWGRVLYLELPAPSLVERARLDPDPEARPLLCGVSVAEEVEQLLALRDPVYRALADAVVPASGDPRAVMLRCRAALDG